MPRQSAPPSSSRRHGKHAAPVDDAWVWGINPVLTLLESRPDRLQEVVIQAGRQGPRLERLAKLARHQGVTVRRASRLPGVSDQDRHQGVAALIRPEPPCSLAALLAACPQQAPLLVALDSIQDPRNLGAIARAAAAAGASGLILPKDRSAPLSGAAMKASAGGLALLRVCRVTNLATALNQLKKDGFWIYGAAGEADTSLYHLDLTGPLCLVIGSEGKGLRPLVRKQCDQLLAIPMPGALDSLNASVAAGVILFEIVRQRRAGKK